MSGSYFNTTGVTGNLLEDFNQKADSQECLIEGFFKRHGRRAFSPSDVQGEVLPSAPLTSVRRAMTNLTHQGLLRKLDATKLGRYDRPEHLWTAPPEWR